MPIINPSIAGDSHQTLPSIIQGDSTTIITLPNLATGGTAPLTYVPDGMNDHEFIMDEFGQRTARPEITSGWKHLSTYVEDVNGVPGNTIHYMLYVVPKNRSVVNRTGYAFAPGRMGDTFHQNLKQTERLKTFAGEFSNQSLDAFQLCFFAGLVDQVNTWIWTGLYSVSLDVINGGATGVTLERGLTSVTLKTGDKEEWSGQNRKDGTFEAVNQFMLNIPADATVRVRYIAILPDNDSNTEGGVIPNPYAYPNGITGSNGN